MHQLWIRVGTIFRCRPYLFFGAVWLLRQLIKDTHVGWARGPRTVVGLVVTQGAPMPVRVGTFLHCRPYLFFRCSAAFQPTDQRFPCRLGQRSENCCRFCRNPRCTDLWVRVGNVPATVADPNTFSVQCAFRPNRQQFSDLWPNLH